MHEVKSYLKNLKKNLNNHNFKKINILIKYLSNSLINKNKVYICGNGGSAGNANHIANDLLYGIAKFNGIGLDVESLSANSSVITCLANDTGYENIFSKQILVKGKKNDLLILLSGSGNSRNIIEAIKAAKKKNMKIFAILGYDGGKVRKMIKDFIHFPINDMQISEDLQLVVLHICMKSLLKQKF
jgi:D-sedoheptulose 7-phosphate isomerase